MQALSNFALPAFLPVQLNPSSIWSRALLNPCSCKAFVGFSTGNPVPSNWTFPHHPSCIIWKFWKPWLMQAYLSIDEHCWNLPHASFFYRWALSVMNSRPCKACYWSFSFMQAYRFFTALALRPVGASSSSCIEPCSCKLFLWSRMYCTYWIVSEWYIISQLTRTERGGNTMGIHAS